MTATNSNEAVADAGDRWVPTSGEREPSTLFCRYIDEYVRCLGSSLACFARTNSKGIEDATKEGHWYAILRGEPKRLRNTTFEEARKRLQRIYDRFRIANVGDSGRIIAAHEALDASAVPFVTWRPEAIHGRAPIVRLDRLRRLYYDNSVELQPGKGGPAAGTETGEDTGPRETSFRREIGDYLACLGRGITDFTGIDAQGVAVPQSMGQYQAILRGDAGSLRDGTWQEIRGRLQRAYDEFVKKAQEKFRGDPSLAAPPAEKIWDLHNALVKSGVSFLTWKPDPVHGQKLEVGLAQLLDLYDRSQGEKRAGGTVKLKVVVRSARLSRAQFSGIVRELAGLSGADPVMVERIVAELKRGLVSDDEGCSTFRIEVSRETADRLVGAFRQARSEGRISTDIVIVCEAETASRAFWEPRPPAPSAAEDAEAQQWRFEQLWRSVQLRRALRAPVRRLRWLMSPSVRLSPLAHAIRDSDGRAYATQDLLKPGARALVGDVIIAWLVWPLFSALLLGATLSAFGAWTPGLAIADGVVSGTVLSIAGGQICAFVISPIAAGAGGLCIGFAFGLAHALIMGRLGSMAANAHAVVESDFFTAVTGGPVGLSAPVWPREFSPPGIALMLALIALSIAAAGWFMAQPINAGPFSPAQWPRGLRAIMDKNTVLRRGLAWGPRRIEVAGGLIGCAAGGAIGVIKGLYSLLLVTHLAPATAFAVGFGIVGAAVFGGTVRVAKHRSIATCVLFAFGYLGIALALCHVVQRTDGFAGFIVLGLLTAIYQATWFTAAFVIGAQFSRHAAVIASVLEGAGGFLGFVLYRMLLA